MKFDRQLPIYNWLYPLKGQNLDKLDLRAAHDELDTSKIRSSALYFHIRFCETICTFCSLNRGLGVEGEDAIEQYVQALIKEIRIKSKMPAVMAVPPRVVWGTARRQLDELVARREQAAEAGLRMPHVKIMQDGICENRTAALGEPYADDPTCCAHPSGMSFLPPDQLAEAVTALERHGFSAHFHALGDRAVHDCLDAVAAARQVNGPRAHRHQIAHVQVVDPADLPRFAALGVTATIQPLWAAAIPHDDSVMQTTPHNRPSSNGLGIAGLVCGILGVLLSWLAFAEFILGVLGVVFGGIGLVQWRRGESTNPVVSGFGVGLGILAIAFWPTLTLIVLVRASV